MPPLEDGFESLDGVQVPYVLTTVKCNRPECPEYGVEYKIKLLYGAEGASCYPCTTFRRARGQGDHRHAISADVMDRLRRLKEPIEWKRNRVLAEIKQQEEKAILAKLGL